VLAEEPVRRPPADRVELGLEHLELQRDREPVAQAADTPPDQHLAGLDDGPHDLVLEPGQIRAPVRVAGGRLGPGLPPRAEGAGGTLRGDPPADDVVDERVEGRGRPGVVPDEVPGLVAEAAEP
jgi:hypothetical protein